MTIPPNNAQLYVLGALGGVSVIVAALVLLFYKGDGGAAIGLLIPIITIFVGQILGIQKSNDAKTEARQASRDIKAVVYDQAALTQQVAQSVEEVKQIGVSSKVVSEQNQQGISQVHQLVNSDSTRKNTQIQELSDKVDRLETLLATKQAEVTAAKTETIDVQAAAIAANTPTH